MRIRIKNLGVIKQAEFSLGDLTIICGKNNSGKTYAMHAAYGFFDFLNVTPVFPVDPGALDRLYKEGSIIVPLEPYLENLNEYLDKAAENYSAALFRVFAGSERQFDNSSVTIIPESVGKIVFSDVEITIGSTEKGILKVVSTKDKGALDVSLLANKSNESAPPVHIARDVISDGIGRAILGSIIPARLFLASAERTGAAIFQKELDFTRNRILELLGDKTEKLHPIQLLDSFRGEYPLAVRRNVDFIRDLPNVVKKESFLLKNHPELLKTFTDIIGGEFRVSRSGEVQYAPSYNSRVKLELVESSSSVRSLLDIGFYLRHMAMSGDLLMIDEPELNLHPENQRKMARLFAMLINVGIKIFVTTHSDYLIKELNTLIAFNQKTPRLLALAEREGYKPYEFMDPSRVRVFVAEMASIRPDGMSRSGSYNTLTMADIDPVMGIQASTFDNSIEEMNRIQDEIYWGDETVVLNPDPS
ncbi:MAG: AAA family ATPase [Aminivibrio sp.]|jgi:predicted ATPase|nr:ATP-binding protein [Synergistaceae bacterium]